MNIINRIHQIEQMLKEDPQDPFLHYALCLEYTKISQTKGKPLWEDLLQEFPEYLPAYYQAGSCFAELGHKEQAIEIWKKGAEEAVKQKDHHTLTELKNIIQNAVIEDDD